MNDLDFDSCNEETEQYPIPAPQQKKCRLWPPILILGILFAVGLLLFFLIKVPVGPITDPDMPWFSLQDGTLYFDQSKYAGGNELTVPASIKGQAVTALSDGCFENLRKVVTVHLPEGITAIGSGAFTGCRALRGIKLPETLTSIGNEAFSGCTALEAICIPYSVTDTGARVFSGCERLAYVFYAGPMASWEVLDISFTDTQPNVYCHDGLFPQE